MSQNDNKHINESINNHSSILCDYFVKYTYVDDYTVNCLQGLNKANLIYEYMDCNFNHILKTFVKPSLNNDSAKNKYIKFPLPKFKFVEQTVFKKALPNKANSIFISFNKDVSTNFIYKDGKYLYYKNQEPFIDTLDNSSLELSNIIVQFCDEDFPNENTKGYGNGLLFQNGGFIKIKWNNVESPIKFYDEKGNDITLIDGKTWWTVINNNTSIIYN